MKKIMCYIRNNELKDSDYALRISEKLQMKDLGRRVYRSEDVIMLLYESVVTFIVHDERNYELINALNVFHTAKN